MKKFSIILAVVLLFAMPQAYCAKPTNTNPAALIKTKAQKKTLESIVTYDSTFCSMRYFADYKLDQLLDQGCNGNAQALAFVARELLNAPSVEGNYGAGCSAFVCKTPCGDVLFCRNFDYDFKASPSNILCQVPAKVSGGNASISMVAANFLGYTAGKISDGKTDISKVIGAPLAQMDGMNDMGVAVCVLQVDSFGAEQYDPDKKNISTSIIMRQILDYASNVDEALEMFRSRNFFAHGGKYRSSYHFLLADKSGRSVVVEYVIDGTKGAPAEANAGVFTMKVIETNWVANNFLWPDWDNPKAKHIRDNQMKSALEASHNVMDIYQAWALLGRISQYHTRWSVIYNLTRGTAELTWEQSGKTLSFKL